MIKFPLTQEEMSEYAELFCDGESEEKTENGEKASEERSAENGN